MKKTKVIIFILINLIFISIGVVVFADTTSDTRTVYISEDSSKYHLKGCDEMHSRPNQTTVATAEKYGWSPCKECNPYGLATTFYGEEEKDYGLLGWILITIFYMAIPIIYKLDLHTWQTKSDLIKFLTWNSIIAFLLLEIMLIYENGLILPQLFVLLIISLVYFCINNIILRKNIKSEVTISSIVNHVENKNNTDNSDKLFKI